MLIRLLSVLTFFCFLFPTGYAQDRQSEASVHVLLPEVQDMNLLSTWQTGNQEFNDIWGYVDSQGKEYAIIGSRSHYYFVDISNPTNPQLVDGFAGGNTTIWRDMKTYGQWAYGVCDNCAEGLSIFRLGDSPAANGVQMVNQTTSFFTRAHNIFVDEPNGRLYVLGSNTQSSGVIILDIQTNPEVPTFLGAFNLPGGYIHDMYVRNHIAYADSGPSGLYVYDLSNPNNPQTLGSLTSYPQQGYNHASWLNDAGDVLIMADETHDRSVKAVDVSDLSDIEVTSLFRSELLAPAQTGSIAHNPFVRDNYAIISYYHDGVQIFDISNPANVEQVAWYDTFTGNTNYSGFDGCWGVYPFLPSGNIIGSDGAGGLFVLEATDITFSPIPPVQPPFGFVNETVGTCIPQGTAIPLSLTTDADVIQWYRNGNLIDVTNSITATSEGTYQAIVYKGPHSLTLDPIEIVFGDAPVVEQVFPSVEVTICGDEGADLLVETDVADSYTWFKDGVVLDQFDGNTIGVEEPGDYTVVITANECETSVVFFVYAEETPEAVLNITETQNLCEGESVLLETISEGDAYQWSTVEPSGPTAIVGEIGQSLMVSESGVYAVEVFLNDCSAFSEVVEINVSAIHTVSLNTTETINLCEGETFTIESIVGSVTDPIVSYDWFNDFTMVQSGPNPNLVVSESGFYEVLARTEFCDAVSASLAVLVSESPVSVITSSTGNSICNGESVVLSSQSTADSYQWSYNGIELGGANESSLTANLAGAYTLELSLGDCNTTSESFMLEVTEAPNVTTDMLPILDICNGESLTLIVEGEAESFEWFKDGTSLNVFDTQITVSDAAIYTLMAANGNCQIAPFNFEVSVTALPTIEVLPISNNTLCFGEEITLTVNTDAEEFFWADPTGAVIAENQPSIVVDINDILGGFAVVAFNGDCEVISEPIFIEAGEVPNVTLQGPVNTNLCVGDSYTFSVDPNFSSYQWFRDGVATTDTESQLQVNDTGDYSVLVTSADGCEATSETILLIFNELPNAQLAVGQNQSLCDGQQLTLEAPSIADSYTWIFNGQSFANTASVDVSEAGVYQLSVTTDACTSVSQEVTVSVTEELTVNFDFGSSIEICEGETFSPNLTQTFDTYQWFLDGEPFSTNRDIEISQLGDYFLMVSSNSCTGESNSFSVTLQDLPSVELSTSGGVALCEGEVLTVMATTTPGASLQWLLEGEPIPNATTSSYTITEGGNYNLQVTNNGCSVESDVIDVFFTPSPISEIEGDTERTLCAGESILLISAEEADTYMWLVDGEEIANQDMPLLEVNEEGEYTLMTFLGECSTLSDAVSVEAIELPNIENIFDDRVLCDGESIDVEVPAGVSTFLWFIDGVGVDDIGETFTIFEAGVYQLSIEQGDCTAMSNEFEVTLLELTALDGAFEDAQICAGESIDITAPMGQGNYTWTRNGNVLSETGSTLSIFESGSYLLEIVQGECSSTSNTFEISVIDLPSLDALPNQLAFCEGEMMTLTAPVGAETYTWTLDGDIISQDAQIQVSTAGAYQLMIGLDECTALSSEIIVTVDELPVAAIVPLFGGEFYCEGGDLKMFSAAENADSIFWFLDGVLIATNQESIDITESGDYTLVAQSGECSAISEIETVMLQPLPTVDIPITEYEFCPNDFKVIMYSGSPSSTNLEYNIFLDGVLVGFVADTSFIVGAGGVFEVQVINADNGCVSELSEGILVTLLDFDIPSITQDGNTLTSSMGTVYQWFLDGVPIPGATDVTYTATTTGEYSVAVLGSNGCSARSEEIIVVISSAAGIPSLDQFEIFPNPVQTFMTVSMTTSKALSLDMEIHNQFGQTLWAKTLQQSGAQNISVPVDFLAPGLYYISLSAADGGVETFRFVKQ